MSSSHLTGVVLTSASHMLVLVYAVIYLASYNCGHATCTAAYANTTELLWAEHKYVHISLRIFFELHSGHLSCILVPPLLW